MAICFVFLHGNEVIFLSMPSSEIGYCVVACTHYLASRQKQVRASCTCDNWLRLIFIVLLCFPKEHPRFDIVCKRYAFLFLYLSEDNLILKLPYLHQFWNVGAVERLEKQSFSPNIFEDEMFVEARVSENKDVEVS